MNIWVTSDQHFFHSNIIQYCNRPFSDVDVMNYILEQKWNDTVKENDILIHLGDLSAGLGGRVDEFAFLLKRLHGQKALILGNHDHQTDEFYLRNGFLRVVKGQYSKNIFLNHIPPQSYKKDIDFIELYETIKPKLLIHGHNHNLTPDIPGQFNCAVDRHDFFPVSIETVMNSTGNIDILGDAYTMLTDFVLYQKQ